MEILSIVSTYEQYSKSKGVTPIRASQAHHEQQRQVCCVQHQTVVPLYAAQAPVTSHHNLQKHTHPAFRSGKDHE